MTLSRRWFDRFLKNQANGVDTGGNAQLAPDPWKGKPVVYSGLPPSLTAPGIPLRGRAQTIAYEGHLARVASTTRAKVETFGSPTATVTATASGGWDHLVAELVAKTATGKTIVVSGGAVPTRPGKRTYTIRMLAQVTAIPARSTLSVIFGSSTSNTPAGLLYLDLPLQGAPKLTIGRATLNLPVLRKPVS
jgi:hypothetical protein